MKTLEKNPNNKWFLTAALLGALVLNSGLWQIKQLQMRTADFSSETDPVRIYEDLKLKLKPAQEKERSTKTDFDKAKELYETAARDKAQTTDNVGRLNASMVEKEGLHKKAQGELKKISEDITNFEEQAKKIITAAGVALPGVKCDSEECRRTQALIDQVAELKTRIDDTKKKDESKSKEKSKEEIERDRTNEELDRVVRICKDSADDKMLKCLSEELVDMLERNKGDKKLVKDLVLKFYRNKIEEQLRNDMMATSSQTVNAAVAAMGRFERSLPSEYNYLREEVIDTARHAGKQLAANSQDYLKAAERVRNSDPALANHYMQMYNYTKDLFVASSNGIDRSLYSNLSSARREKLVTDSWMQANYMRDWREPMSQITRGLLTNPRTLRITDEDDFAIEHLYETALTRGLNLGSNISAGRSRGRNASTRLGDSGGVNSRLGNSNGSRLGGDVYAQGVEFGNLGTPAGGRSGRNGRSGKSN